MVDIKKKRLEVIELLLSSKNKAITCPVCKNGKFSGIFFHSCDNPQCKLYDEVALSRCGICGQRRIYCTCW